MREKKDGQQASDLPVYESHPPEWLPKIHGSADLGGAPRWQSFSSISLLIIYLSGYAGFHPPRPGQDEDALSEPNVKNGYILAQAVSVSDSSTRIC